MELVFGHNNTSLEPFCFAEQCLVKYFDADSSGVAGLSPLLLQSLGINIKHCKMQGITLGLSILALELC